MWFFFIIMFYQHFFFLFAIKTMWIFYAILIVLSSILPLQYSCLENPMDGGAWKAAVHGVAEGWTRLHFHFHFSRSCIEGNGNPLQCSCLENPRDWGALWAAVYGVAQSWTRLKWLSPSSNSKYTNRNATAGHTVCVILTFNWPFQFVFPCYQLHFNQNTLSELSFSSIFTNT